MKRTKATPGPATPADAVLVSDLHLTDSTPVSRTDDYMEAQKRKLIFLQELSDQNNNCPVLCAGDVFDHWKASPALCTMAYHYLPRPFICIPGQHDLPMHSLEEFPRSALGLIDSVTEDDFLVLRQEDWSACPNLYMIGVPFGKLSEFVIPTNIPWKTKRKILILHELTWKSQRPAWDKGGGTDQELLKKFGERFDLILVGDNHGGFVTQYKNSLLVNPGSMMRMNADQEDYQPQCYLYYAETNTVRAVDFPIQRDVHDRKHLDVKKERDERIAAYIERMSQDWEIGLSFRRNLETFFTENNTPKKVREIICQHLESPM